MKDDTILEKLIDKYGFEEFMCSCFDICYDKAAHIQQHYQDEYLTSLWLDRARTLSKIK